MHIPLCRAILALPLLVASAASLQAGSWIPADPSEMPSGCSTQANIAYPLAWFLYPQKNTVSVGLTSPGSVSNFATYYQELDNCNSNDPAKITFAAKLGTQSYQEVSFTVTTGVSIPNAVKVDMATAIKTGANSSGEVACGAEFTVSGHHNKKVSETVTYYNGRTAKATVGYRYRVTFLIGSDAYFYCDTAQATLVAKVGTFDLKAAVIYDNTCGQ